MNIRLDTARAAYITAFGALPPEPFGIDDERLAEVLELAIVAGQPVPDSFDWWQHLPKGASA